MGCGCKDKCTCSGCKHKHTEPNYLDPKEKSVSAKFWSKKLG